MKCPKCSYLGFETGDRCKNCGYDFSLLAHDSDASPDIDVAIRAENADTDTPADLPLPLFTPGDTDDIPLISLPAAPRPPLAVRRTPDAPRGRAVSKLDHHPEPALNFREEVGDDWGAAATELGPGGVARIAVERTDRVGGRRVLAALIDHAILLAIDACVIYFTLRMAGLNGSLIGALPLAPLGTFLVLHKLAYFTAFTAVGGQTIGKMTMGIRVVGEEGDVDGARAVRRTLAGLLSLLPLGLGFLPAFFGADRRALHDRLTHTRVVALPSA